MRENAVLLPSIDMRGESSPGAIRLHDTCSRYQAFCTKAIGLVPLKVWKQQSLFEMEAMAEIPTPTADKLRGLLNSR